MLLKHRNEFTENRNEFTENGWILRVVGNFNKLKDFDCGNDDLNEFFQKDCYIQRQELLHQTYSLTEATVKKFFPVALISLCNDSIRKEKIIDWLGFKGTKKVYPSYPAVKIARFGVRNELKKRNLGTYTINIIKKMFVTNNRTGCRFLTVDAYNKDYVLSFYKHNDFQFFSDKDKQKEQRAMFFDLKRLNLDSPEL
jgi:hypothetical protein